MLSRFRISGGWSQADANNAENSMSHTGYVINYSRCPVLWCRKLQIEIALSTTEALSNTFYGISEVRILYFRYTSSKEISLL